MSLFSPRRGFANLATTIPKGDRASNSPTMAAFVAGLIALTFIGVAAGSYFLPRLIFLHDLAASHRVTQGTIIETFPQMHSTCKYRYLVDGRPYEQTGVACGHYNVGQQLTVYFSTVDPRKSWNRDPASAFVNDLIPFVAALTLFPMISALVTYYRAR
jgi:hypothetical protein